MKRVSLLLLATCLIASLPVPVRAGDDGWISLFDGKSFEAWRGPRTGWQAAGSVALDPAQPRWLKAGPGTGIMVDARGRAHDLVSKQKFGDVLVHVEFLIPRHSNSGVKLEGLYEIQILDSWGKKQLTGADCGGLYPRAEMEPTYHHIDNGVPPRTNACRPPGEWQTLDIAFQAPRFDARGKKIANARFVKVVLNGQVIHENLEARTPTGHAWHDREIPAGPLLLQADHGPVAFRNVRVRPLVAHPSGRSLKGS